MGKMNIKWIKKILGGLRKKPPLPNPKEDGNIVRHIGPEWRMDNLYVPVGNTVDVDGYRLQCHSHKKGAICEGCDVSPSTTSIVGICSQMICSKPNRQLVNPLDNHGAIYFKIVGKAPFKNVR